MFAYLWHEFFGTRLSTTHRTSSLTRPHDRLWVVALSIHHNLPWHSMQRLPIYRCRSPTEGPTCFWDALAIASVADYHQTDVQIEYQWPDGAQNCVWQVTNIPEHRQPSFLNFCGEILLMCSTNHFSICDEIIPTYPRIRR